VWARRQKAVDPKAAYGEETHVPRRCQKRCQENGKTSPERLGDEVIHWDLGSHLRYAAEDGARHLHLLWGTPRHGPSEKAELKFGFVGEGVVLLLRILLVR
jgi:hypothetical protein